MGTLSCQEMHFIPVRQLQLSCGHQQRFIQTSTCYAPSQMSLALVALYHIDIVAEYIAGATNQVADILSRNRDQFLSQYPQVSRFSTPLKTITTSHSVSPQARLDIPKLQGLLQRNYLSGLAPTTRNTYSAGQKQNITFCSYANRILIRTSESTLLLSVAHLTTLNPSYAIIKVFLSSVQHMHFTAGEHSNFTQQLTSCLQQVLKGIQKTQSATQPPSVRQSITLSIMQSMKHLLLQKPPFYDNMLIGLPVAWPYLAFYGSVNLLCQLKANMTTLLIYQSQM